MTFGDGQPTADVTSYLPLCVVGSGSGPWIRLEKTDGSIVLAETGAFSGGTLLFVNSTAHPILDTSYTGLYHCRTVDHNSSHTYQLNIVGKVKTISYFLCNNLLLTVYCTVWLQE